MSSEVDGPVRRADDAKPAAARVATPSDHTPICFVVDSDANIRRMMFAELRGLQVQSDLFEKPAEMLQYCEEVRPDLLFVDITTSLSSAIELVETLAKAQLACPIQIMTGLNPVLVEQIRRIGERRGLQLLPVLHKPFRPNAIRKILQALNLRRDGAATAPEPIGHSLAFAATSPRRVRSRSSISVHASRWWAAETGWARWRCV